MDDLVEDTKGLPVLAKQVMDSLQGEVFPAKAPLPTPQVTMQTLLASSAPFASDEGRAQAEAAVTATWNAIRGFIDIGTAATDPTL